MAPSSQKIAEITALQMDVTDIKISHGASVVCCGVMALQHIVWDILVYVIKILINIVWET